MASGSKNQGSASAQNRMHGEGEPIDVRITAFGKSKIGENEVEISQVQVELTSAPAPARKFVADGFQVICQHSTIRLLFIQTKLDGQTARAIIDIHLTHQGLSDLVNFILKDIPVDESNFASPMSLIIEPEQTVALAANQFRSAVNPSASCLDFYYASPFSLMSVNKLNKLYVDSIVRVQITDYVISGLAKELRRIVANQTEIK